MIKEHAKKFTDQISSLDQKGDDVMTQIGVLGERSEGLKDPSDEAEADPEEVGRWITTIGRALLAIFKP